MKEGIIPNMKDKPERTIEHLLCNSFGFGGNDSSLLFSKYHPV
jgi:3-oxoacyl-(acyl-carrier-protein) synthase